MTNEQTALSLLNQESVNIKEFLTKPVYELAELLKLVPMRRSTILNEVKAGKLKTGKLGARLLFFSDSILEWLEGMRTQNQNLKLKKIEDGLPIQGRK